MTAIAPSQVIRITASSVVAPKVLGDGLRLRGSSASGTADLTISASSGVLTINPSGNIINIGGNSSATELRFLEPSGSGTNFTAFKAQAQSADITYLLPSADATGFLKNTSGTLSWETVSASPGGSDTQIQYNGSSAFAGSANLVWHNTNVRMGIGPVAAASLTEQLEISNAAADTFTSSQNIGFSYSPAPTTYRNDIRNKMSGTASSHVMEFRLTSAGSAVVPLWLSADNKVHIDGTPIFSTAVGIDNGGNTPAAVLEISSTDITDGEMIALTYKTVRDRYSKIKQTLVGGAPEQSYLRFSVGTGNADSTNDTLDLYGNGVALIGGAAGGAIVLIEKTAEPSDPAQGQGVIWLTDGTGFGDDGDICAKSNPAGTVKKNIIHDHSAGT